jgi:hypothetical protein
VSRRSLGWVLLIGAAMGCQDHWRPADAVQPGLERLDADGDGSLDQAELLRGSPVPVDIATVDADGDQRVDTHELLASLRATDPSYFDDAEAPIEPAREDVELIQPDPRPVRSLRELFEFMITEIHRLAPGRPLPGPEQIAAAATTGSLDSPESQAVAAELVRIYTELELMLPPALQTVRPATEP